MDFLKVASALIAILPTVKLKVIGPLAALNVMEQRDLILIRLTGKEGMASRPQTPAILVIQRQVLITTRPRVVLVVTKTTTMDLSG